MLQLNEMFNRIQNSMDINKSRSFYAGRFQGKHAWHDSNLDGIGMRGQVNTSHVINKLETVPRKKRPKMLIDVAFQESCEERR